MRHQRFPTSLFLALLATGCTSPEEKVCSEGYALASDGNCYEVASGFGGDVHINGWTSPLATDPGGNANFGDCGIEEGYYDGLRHAGADYGRAYSVAEGNPVYSVADGECVEIWGPSSAGTGNVAVALRHESTAGSVIAIYGHIVPESSLCAMATDSSVCTGGRSASTCSGVVEDGELLGVVGDYSGGDHLHFGILPGDSIPADVLAGVVVGWGRVKDADCTLDPDDADDMYGFVPPYTYLQTYEPAGTTTHDGYFSGVALDGALLTVSGKVWAAEGIEKFTITVGDDTTSSDPSMYTEDYGGSTTEDWFGPLTIDLGDTDLETGSHDVGLWVEDTEGVAELVDVGGPIDYTAESGSGTVDFDPAASPTVDPPSVTAGDLVTVEFEIDNDGSAPSGSYTVAAYLSTDTSWGSSDRELDSWAMSSLGAGATGSYTKSLEIPSSTAAGTYRVIIVADPDDDVSEVTETDNTAYSSTVTVSASSTTVDLDPTTPTASPRSVTAGDSVTVTGDVDNDGTGSSGSFTMAAYLSTNTAWSSTSDTLLATWTQSSISAGGSESYSESFALPSTTPSGTYYLIVVVDPDDDLAEVTETNNTAYSSTLTVSAASTTVDLDPATPSVSPRAATAGDSISVTGDVDNDGTGSSGSFTMAAYLSTNTSWSSTSDTLLDTWTESSISAGGTGSYSESVLIPSSTSSGTYYVIVVADPDDDISEVTETDNTAYSSTVTVTAACTATDYWSPDSTTDTVEGRTADGTTDGTGNGTDLEIEIQDDGTGDLEFRVCKSSSRFSGSDIWVTFDEDESGYGTSLFDQAVSTSSSSYCTSWQSLGVSSSTEGDLIGGDWHVESSATGMTWGAGCTDDGDTSSDCWFFDGHDTLERTCL